jgi:hypothetical protein
VKISWSRFRPLPRASKHYLYGERWSLLFSDKGIKELIIKKFSDLAQKQLEISSTELEGISVRRQKNPFPFPHSDVAIYKKNIFVVSRSGVHRATCSKSKGNPISSRPERKWDAPVLAVDVSYLSLAHAAGDEGLFELGISEPGDYGFDGETYNKPKRIGKRNCTDCDWIFYSIYGSSHVDDGFLASYRKVQQKHEPFFFQRIFENLISAENIFHNGGGYSWGNQDKLCQVSGSKVRVITRHQLSTLGRRETEAIN